MFILSFRPIQQIALVILLLTVISGCIQKRSNIQTLLETLDVSILEGSEVIQKSTNAIYESIKSKREDPVTKEQALIILKKADSVRNYTKKIQLDLAAYKKKIVSKGITMNDSDLSSKLFKLIKKHNSDLLNMDILFDTIAIKTQLKLYRFESRGFHLFEKNLAGVGDAYQSIFIDKLCADAVVDENTLLNHLHSQLRSYGKCVVISPIVGISSAVISLGDSIEIYAGIGYFESVKGSKMIVDGVTVYPAKNGLFAYQYKPIEAKGKKIIPVQVYYIDMDGNDVVTETKIAVTVK